MGLSALAIAALATAAAGTAATYLNQKHAEDERNAQLQKMQTALNTINQKRNAATHQVIQNIAQQSPAADEDRARKQYLDAITAAQHAAKGDISTIGTSPQAQDYADQEKNELAQYGQQVATDAGNIYGPQALRRQTGYSLANLGGQQNYWGQLADLIRSNYGNAINQIQPNPFIAALAQGAQGYGFGGLGNFYNQKAQKSLKHRNL